MKKLNIKGFTLIEMLIVIGILGVLAVALLLTINPAEAQKKSRDTKRMRDLATIQTLVDQTISDGRPLSACLTSAAGCASTLTNSVAPQPCAAGANWLGIDVCIYTQTVPVDPANFLDRTIVSGPGTGTAVVQMGYRARVSGSEYEITVRQEAVGNRPTVTNDGALDSWVISGTSTSFLPE